MNFNGKQLMKHNMADSPLWTLSSARFRVVLMMVTCNVICYVDRINISIAIVEMTKEHGWNRQQEGYILSAFFWGYASTQIIGGKLATKYGGHAVLMAAVTAWSLCTLMTPFVTGSLPLLIASRVLIGLGEGMSQPAIHSVIVTWIPPPERTRCIALASSGMIIGTVASMLSSSLVAWSWRAAFLLYGSVGLIWVGIAFMILRRNPRDTAISNTELTYIESFKSKDSSTAATVKGLTVEPPTVSELLTSYPFLSIMVIHFAYNWGWYIILSWIPTYFTTTAGISTKDLGFFGMLPFIAMWILDVSWGNWIDSKLEGGMSTRDARVLSAAVHQLGPAAVLAYISFFPPKSGDQAVIFLTICVALKGSAHSSYWANVMDIAPSSCAVLLGLSNTVASFAGILGNIYVGWALNQDSWELVWMSAVFWYVTGYTVYWAFASGDKLWP
eukprot:m.159502 g.159502  ORF g.159502 m.159502 type:complete len:443 (+) comp15154_c0_seq1:228-1556(+)